MPVAQADELDASAADNAKELLALADRIERRGVDHIGIAFGLDSDYRRIVIDVLRLSARQQASVEEVAQILDPSAFVDLGPGFKRAQKIEMELVTLKARALLAKYDIFEKVEK